MLKRKLRATALATNGLLLITAVASIAATHQTGGSKYTVVSDTTLRQLNFDTTFLTISGLSETDELEVPAITMNKQAKEYVTSYMAKNNETLEKIKAKSEKSFAVIDKVFSQYGLPLELKYLAVIESELQSKALSRVGARGVWQFMPATARILSLKVGAKYDERTHLYKSTVAAAKYLRDLYKIFGDWTLVIAAYNSGPGPVFNAIKKSGSRNFWKLQHHLPAETRGHVKKFIGAHYYFEGKGSVTTLTKQEVAAYKKIMTTFVTEQNILLKEKQEALARNTDTLSTEEIAKTNAIIELKQVVEK
jgi:membrane-bound lytic murein transglycosylase D